MKSKSFALLYKKNKFKYCTCLLLPDITTIIRLCLYFSISLICEMTEMYLVWVFMLLLWYKRRNNYWYYHNSAPILWSASQLRQWLAPILSVFSFSSMWKFSLKIQVWIQHKFICWQQNSNPFLFLPAPCSQPWVSSEARTSETTIPSTKTTAS